MGVAWRLSLKFSLIFHLVILSTWALIRGRVVPALRLRIALVDSDVLVVGGINQRATPVALDRAGLLET